MFMHPIAILCTVFSVLMSWELRAQVVPQYSIDTARFFSPGCDTLPVYAYFQVKGKYPESSQTLTKWADNSLKALHLAEDANGYITFKILIDCSGKLASVKLLQTNERYEACFFSKDLVETLYAFVRSLINWKAGQANGSPVNYAAYLSFKIEHNHVVQVSP